MPKPTQGMVLARIRSHFVFTTLLHSSYFTLRYAVQRENLGKTEPVYSYLPRLGATQRAHVVVVAELALHAAGHRLWLLPGEVVVTPISHMCECTRIARGYEFLSPVAHYYIPAWMDPATDRAAGLTCDVTILSKHRSTQSLFIPAWCPRLQVRL